MQKLKVDTQDRKTLFNNYKLPKFSNLKFLSLSKFLILLLTIVYDTLHIRDTSCHPI